MMHEEVAEMVELYALHALDESEELWVESHLDTCEECEARLAAALTATAALVEDSEPPSHVWGRIVAAIEEGPSPVGAPVW